MRFLIQTLCVATLLLAALAPSSEGGVISYSVKFTDLDGNEIVGGIRESDSSPFGNAPELGSFSYSPTRPNPNEILPLAPTMPIFDLGATVNPLGTASNGTGAGDGVRTGEFVIQVTLTDASNTNNPGMLEIVTEGIGTFTSTGMTTGKFTIDPVNQRYAFRGAGVRDNGKTAEITIAGQSYTFGLGPLYGLNNFGNESMLTDRTTVNIFSTPEPASLTMLGAGLGVLAIARLRRGRKAA